MFVVYFPNTRKHIFFKCKKNRYIKYINTTKINHFTNAKMKKKKDLANTKRKKKKDFYKYHKKKKKKDFTKTKKKKKIFRVNRIHDRFLTNVVHIEDLIFIIVI